MKKIFKSTICQILIMSFLSLPVQASMYEQTRGSSTDSSWKQPVVESNMITNSWSGDHARQITIGVKTDQSGEIEPENVAISNNGGLSKLYTINVLHTVGGSENAGAVVDQAQADEDFCALGIDCGTRKTKVVWLVRDSSKGSPVTSKLLENNMNKYMRSCLPVLSHDDLFMLQNSSAPRIGWDNLFTGSPFSGGTSYATYNSDESSFDVAVVDNDVLASPDADPFLLKKAERGFFPVWDKVSSLNYAENEKYYNQQEMGYLVWAERMFKAYSSHNEEIFDKLKEASNVCIVVSTSSTTSPLNRQRMVAALKYVFENVHGINANGEGLRYYVVDSVESANLSYLYEHSYRSDSVLVNVGHSELSLSGVNPYTGKVYDTEAWYGMGGATIDRILCNYFENKIKEECGIELSKKMLLNIQKSAVLVKEQLSADGASVIKFETEIGDEDFECEFSIDDFNKLLVDSGFINSLKVKVRDYVGEFIDANNSGDAPITAVFSGGAIRSPIIKQSILEAIRELGVEAKSQSTLNFDECSAYGGCYSLLFKRLPNFVEEYTEKAANLNPDVLYTFDELLSEYTYKVELGKVKNQLEAYIYDVQRDNVLGNKIVYNGKTIFQLTSEILDELKSKGPSGLVAKLREINHGIRSLSNPGPEVSLFWGRVLIFLQRISRDNDLA